MICSECVSGGAKMPPNRMPKSAWKGKASDKKILEQGLTFE